jgi:hypothetical protein
MTKPIEFYLSKKSPVDLDKLEHLTLKQKAAVARELTNFFWARTQKRGGYPGQLSINQVAKSLGITCGEAEDMESAEVARIAAALLLQAADSPA